MGVGAVVGEHGQRKTTTRRTRVIGVHKVEVVGPFDGKHVVAYFEKIFQGGCGHVWMLRPHRTSKRCGTDEARS